MSLVNCNCRGNCTVTAVIVSAIAGVIAAFLQITGTVTVTPAFLWVAFGIAVLYLEVQLVSATLLREAEETSCMCAALNVVLAGILGTILLALLLLAVGIVATSVVSAILVGLLVFSLVLTLTATACLIRCIARCES